MKQIKIPRTPAQYRVAVARLEKLSHQTLPPNRTQADEIELLSLVIEEYENRNAPPCPTDPIEAIKFTMGQKGLQRKDLVPYIGSAVKVTEVLSGTRKLTLIMIRKLYSGLGISADILIKGAA